MKPFVLFSLFFFFSLPALAQFKAGQLIELLPGKSGSPVVIQELAHGNKKLLQFNLSKLSLNEKKWQQKKWFQLEMKSKEFNLTTTPGAPELPYYSVLLQGRPEDFDLHLDLGASKLLSSIELSPAPYLPCRCAKDGDKINYEMETRLYQAWETPKFYEMQYLGDYRGTALTKLSIYPVQYSWQRKEVMLYPELSLSVENKNLGQTPLYKDFGQLLAQTRPEGARYLILAPLHLTPALADFIAWKQQLGLTVEVVNEASYGSSFEQIQNFLQARFKDEETRFDYLLLVGDETIMPTAYVPTKFDRNTPSDLRYLTYGGVDDSIPDTFYGRLVVQTEADIKNQVRKWMQYEQGLFTDPSGLGRGIGIASNEGSAPSDVEYLKKIHSYFEKNAGTKFTLFEENSANATAENINQAVNNGALWMTYIGHGSGTSWPSIYKKMPYTNNHVGKLRPTEVRPIIIDVSCANGRFKVNPGSSAHLGERWANQAQAGNPLGATSYYGGSVDISWHPPAKMAVGIAQELFEKNLHSLGEVILAGQMYLASHHDNVSEVVENLTWYHLFGDPSLTVRTAVPKKVAAKVGEQQLWLAQGKSGNRATKVKARAFINMENGPAFFLWSDEDGRFDLPLPVSGGTFSILEKDFPYLKGSLDGPVEGPLTSGQR